MSIFKNGGIPAFAVSLLGVFGIMLAAQNSHAQNGKAQNGKAQDAKAQDAKAQDAKAQDAKECCASGPKECCGSSGAILDKQALRELIGSAKTMPEHERLAAHFSAQADLLESQAAEHEELAAKYRANPTIQERKTPGASQTISHCESLAKQLRAAAKEARQLAADHRAMGKACGSCAGKQ
jgi:hypothetical protein